MQRHKCSPRRKKNIHCESKTWCALQQKEMDNYIYILSFLTPRGSFRFELVYLVLLGPNRRSSSHRHRHVVLSFLAPRGSFRFELKVDLPLFWSLSFFSDIYMVIKVKKIINTNQNIKSWSLKQAQIIIFDPMFKLEVQSCFSWAWVGGSDWWEKNFLVPLQPLRAPWKPVWQFSVRLPSISLPALSIEARSWKIHSSRLTYIV